LLRRFAPRKDGSKVSLRSRQRRGKQSPTKRDCKWCQEFPPDTTFCREVTPDSTDQFIEF